MALSWTDILPDVDGEPVRASLDEVDGVATMFERMGDASQRILDEFERVTSDAGTGSLEGDAADAFRDIVDKVAGSLGDLPAVCDDAHGALADHLSRLGDLRSEAASALARARTRWEAHEDAVRALSSRRSSHDQATADLDSLPPAGADPAADADRTAAEDGVEQSGRLLAAAEGAVDSAADDLRASREEWGRLRGDEDELNDRTADRLDDISLGDLEDPSWWESILGSAFDLVMDLTGLDALIDLVAAIASGDWAAALWALRELLDRVLMIVAVIALFTPLGPLVLALVAIKMAASLALYATKWPHPETGQTIGLTDVAMDSADLLGAAGDVIIAGRGRRDQRRRLRHPERRPRPRHRQAPCRGQPRAGATCPRSRSVEAGTRSRRSTSTTRRAQGTRPSSPSIGRARRNDAVSRCVGTRASRVSTATSTRRPCSRRGARALAFEASTQATTVVPAPRWATRLGTIPTALGSDWW